MGTYGGTNGISASAPIGSGLANYAIVYTPGALTITPKIVTLSASKTYDGNNLLGSGTVTISGTVGSQTLNYTGATAYSANVVGVNFITCLLYTSPSPRDS